MKLFNFKAVAILGAVVLSSVAHAFEFELSKPEFLVAPAKWPLNVQLPKELPRQHSNNNLALARFQGHYYLAYRSAPTHFASPKTQMIVLSSKDDGQNWVIEKSIEAGTDLREPFFFELNGELHFTYMTLGKKMFKFEPGQSFQMVLKAPGGEWTDALPVIPKGEMIWEIKVRTHPVLSPDRPIAWMTSYEGNHYQGTASNIRVNFRISKDGINWVPVRGDGNPTVYTGGVSEVAFEFDDHGNLFAIGRNEDGDSTGWGTQHFFANAVGLGSWEFRAQSDSFRYDSPRMFKWKDKLFLVSRKDVGGPFDRGARRFGFQFQKWWYLIRYSLKPKAVALYELNTKTQELEEVTELPGAGDTAFPSIVQVNENEFKIGNYTSPLNKKRWKWIRGQLSRFGTGIYWVSLRLE